MADNTFRMTRRDAAAPAGQQSDDPLAELARLIGRSPPAGNAPDQHYEQPLDAPQSDPQWAQDARYGEQQYDQPQHDDRQYDERQAQYDDRQSQYGESQHGGDQYNEGQYREGQYNENQYDDRHDAPRLADPYPPAYGAAPQSYNTGYEQPDQYDTRRYSDQPQQYDTRGYSDQPRQSDTRGYSDEPQYDDAHDPVQEVPAFLPRMRGERRDDRYDYAQDQGQGRGQAYAQDYDQNGQDDYEQDYAQEGDADDRGYALEDYEEDDEAPAPRRRGFAIAAALVGVIVLGTSGWFAYGAMFGGTGLPALPPIIRADNTPNKIIPPNNAANASGQTANSGSPDRLVSREEKPVDVPAPANAPRVVSTVPVFPDPNASMIPGGQNMAGQSMPGAVASGGPPGGSLGPTAAGSAYGSSAAPAAQLPPIAPQNVPPLQSPPVAGAGNAKKIHTVAIHNGQMDNSDSDAGASARAPAARPAPSRPGSNAPMSIMPSQGSPAPDAAPPARTAVARPQATEPAPSAAPVASGYFVQVSSQRSEADAQSAYQGLQAKFPSQLGGHEPTIRQVDLGEKGIYYRTLVGPYGSMEQAAQMCSSLKAAGGSCLVQRN